MYHLTGRSLNIKRQLFYVGNRNHKFRPINFNENERILIIVSGVRYETFASTLDRYPETIFGSPVKRALMMAYDRSLIIYRSHVAFETILFFFQSSGNLTRPESIPMKEFVEECKFYGLPESAVNQMKQNEAYLSEIIQHDGNTAIKKLIRNFIDYPKKFQISYISYFYVVCSYILMLISIVVICVESELLLSHDKNLSKQYIKSCHELEKALHIFFMTEFILRLLVHPFQLLFIKKPLNAIEIFSYITYFISLVVPVKHLAIKHFFLYVSRSCRAIRIARFSKLSNLVRIVALVFKIAFYDVLAVGYVLLIVSVLNGSIMYYIEMNVPNTKFTCIPESMWWALQTVICLGYGDIIPTTTYGKCVGGALMIIGVIIMTVLLLSLGGRFFDTYSKELYQKEFLPKGVEDIDYEIHYRAYKELKNGNSNASLYKGYKTALPSRKASEVSVHLSHR